MKPVPFDYRAPRTIREAVTTLATTDADCRVLAGGQSLVPLLNARRVRPDVVVDINHVTGLDGIHVTPESVTIGAMTRLDAVERDAALRSVLPVLPETAALVAHPPIRTRATFGGSLCHADPSSELPALVVALGARLHLRSVRGRRAVAAEEFFRSAWDTVREPDELLVVVEFVRRPGFRVCFEEVVRGGGFPLVGLCMAVEAGDDGVVGAARLAGAGVADRPLRLRAVERALVGRRLSGDLGGVLDAVSAEAVSLADCHGDAAYRRGVLRSLIRRSAERLAGDRNR